MLSISGTGSATVTGSLIIWYTGGNSSVIMSGGSLSVISGMMHNRSATFRDGSASLTTIDGVGTLLVTKYDSLNPIHVRQGSLSIGSGSTVTIADSPAPGITTATSILTDLYNSGTLDLKNNDLIVTRMVAGTRVAALALRLALCCLAQRNAPLAW